MLSFGTRVTNGSTTIDRRVGQYQRGFRTESKLIAPGKNPHDDFSPFRINK